MMFVGFRKKFAAQLQYGIAISLIISHLLTKSQKGVQFVLNRSPFPYLNTHFDTKRIEVGVLFASVKVQRSATKLHNAQSRFLKQFNENRLCGGFRTFAAEPVHIFRVYFLTKGLVGVHFRLGDVHILTIYLQEKSEKLRPDRDSCSVAAVAFASSSRC